jgi:hypothetical protein
MIIVTTFRSRGKPQVLTSADGERATAWTDKSTGKLTSVQLTFNDQVTTRLIEVHLDGDVLDQLVSALDRARK